MTRILTRFAPSPTGLLHVGNVRTALVSWLYAHAKGGKFLLRIDDTDKERSKAEYVDAIKEDLTWLGLSWDAYFHQSDRFARYEEIKQQLLASGRLYPCYETPEELEVKRKMLLGRGLPPIYDRAALKLTDQQKAEFEKQGRKPHWRFLLNSEMIEWVDEIRGETQFDPAKLSDPILIRADGSFLYMLPSAIDDMDEKVTHIIRGEDHVSNTAIQIQIFKAMGATLPGFAHLPLVTTKDASISKRTGGFDIRSLRELGFEAMTINSFLCKLGTSHAIEARANLKELVEEFNIAAFGRAPTHYDTADIERLNAKLLHVLPFEQVKAHLARLGMEGVDEAFWEVVKPNVTKLQEVTEWWRICKAPLTPEMEDAEFTRLASTLLPDGHWDSTTWEQWINKVKDVTGRKGKPLFMPIRKALTAIEHGPELKQILPLIGREKALKRLQGETA